MATLKVLGLVSSCGQCPNCKYHSGGISRCVLVEEQVLDKSIVAPFCPLLDFPSSTIADMQRTISGLREPLKYGLGLNIATYLAAKFNLNLAANGSGLIIPFRDMGIDRKVYLDIDYISNIKVNPCEIIFRSGESIFKLYPGNVPPLLHEAGDKEDDPWRHHELVA